MDGDDSIEPVVLAGQKRSDFEALDLLPQRVEVGADFAGNIFAFAGQLEIGFQVREPAGQAVVGLERLFESPPLDKDLLGSSGVLPKRGISYLLFDGFEFASSLQCVKGSSANRLLAVSNLHTLFAVLQSRLLHF